jgi:hypothetical protein
MTRFIRSRFTAGAAMLILLAGACRSPYRESVPPASSDGVGARPIINLGIYDASDGAIDANASHQLVEASGLDLFPSTLPPQDAALLVGDPGLLAFDRPGRRRLTERIGMRHVLIGMIRPVAVDELREWGLLMPIPLLVMPVLTLIFSPVAIPYGLKRDVIHEAITIRLVDLDSGTVDAEILTITNRSRDRHDRMEKSAIAAARVMRLRAAR